MGTTKLYKNDRYLRECSAIITSVKIKESAVPHDGKKNHADTIDITAGSGPETADNSRRSAMRLYEITLDRTIFFPEGGGQSCDTGTIGNLKVTDVQEGPEDEIVHTALCTDSDTLPKAGDEVFCRLDWDRRFDNMQRHCGEHILSGIFYDMFGGVNRGFHMGHDYMTIDINLEDTPGMYSGQAPDTIPEINEITYDMALAAELAANEVIWSDAPVSVMHFDTREEAAGLPLRKALAFDEDISIVCVGSPDKASDCVACCGTHPSSAGQVGLIKIYKVEKYKGMFRIYFEAGKRALQDYRMKHDILTELSDAYSSSIEDFPEKLRAQEEKLRSVKDELYHIKNALIEKECCQLDEIIASDTSEVLKYTPAHFSLDDAFEMAKNYIKESSKKKGKKGKKNESIHSDNAKDAGRSDAMSHTLDSRLLMLYSEKDTSYILVSGGDHDCGSLVREYASFYNGKGGGSRDYARAIFTTAEDAALFADLIKKHLR